MKKSNAKGTNYLMIDIKNDLKNIDSFMTKIITDKKLKERFFKNPSKVAIELGLHPPTTKIAIGISFSKKYPGSSGCMVMVPIVL